MNTTLLPRNCLRIWTPLSGNWYHFSKGILFMIYFFGSLKERFFANVEFLPIFLPRSCGTTLQYKTSWNASHQNQTPVRHHNPKEAFPYIQSHDIHIDAIIIELDPVVVSSNTQNPMSPTCLASPTLSFFVPYTSSFLPFKRTAFSLPCHPSRR